MRSQQNPLVYSTSVILSKSKDPEDVPILIAASGFLTRIYSITSGPMAKFLCVSVSLW
jgi:hypothetical protein